ncbi:MAG: alkaline phosphatase family protein [Chitinophagales bacterium]|nr:alkaline phosphatase family protein [Chitinophagales bacterium]
MNRFSLLCLLIGIAIQASAQSELLQSGPMLGYSEMKEVLLWVQTTESANVQFAYWPEGESAKKANLTDAVKTTASNAFTAKLIANQVEPGMTYDYELRINGKAVKLDYATQFKTQPLWQYRVDPPPFSMAIGSCSYINEEEYDRPGRPYGGQYEIFTSIHKKQPDAMLWLGDNFYLREADWYTMTGIQHRYTHTRSLPELQPLLASTHHYAIWDDHDFGPNDSNRSFIHKDKTLVAFEDFWGNPTFGLPDMEGGITTFFQYHDIDFFLLDNRYFRSPNYRESGERTILGEEQLEWLIDALSTSRANFKMVCIGGQVLNTYAGYENYANHHAAERAYLLEQIEAEGIRNVIFLTGDRHHTELSQYTNAQGNIIYDLTVSPLTAGFGGPSDEEVNRLREEGTLVRQRNFGLLEFSGPRQERQLKMTVCDTEGKELWSKTIISE